MRRAPYSALVPGGEELARPPAPPHALAQRMAEIYGVDATCVLPVRDAAHGLELVARLAHPDRAGLSEVNHVASPSDDAILTADAARALAKAATLLVIDESLIEFASSRSLAPFAAASDNIAVLRSLSFAYGLAGAPCGAIVAAAALIEHLKALCGRAPLATPVVKLALAALDPSRLPLTAERIAAVKSERARLAAALSTAGIDARAGAGPHVLVRPADAASIRAAITAIDLDAEEIAPGNFRFAIGAPEYNARILAAFGLSDSARAPRRAEIVRDTKETRIAVAVDLDSAGETRVATGIGFYDHMLSQVALHGGFQLKLTCAGDLHIDAHHTIEDCAIALGQAIDKALGERRGIGRFGFLLPMDETEAQISIDLGGRPFAVFKGEFAAPLLGSYPTEMTNHVFRSLAESMRAAIHVTVSGDNDHHKTEACFKAFGRALRAALRVEGDALPSTKGVL